MTDDGRMNSRVGIVVVPEYFDTTAKELQSLSPGIDVLHTQIRVGADFGWTLADIADTADEISDCAASLAAAGAEVVLQLGTPYSTAHGWERGNELQQRIADRIGVPFEMMGLSVPAGVHALGARRVVLATTYYGPAWVERYTAFVTEAGLDVVGAQGFVDQGRRPSYEAAWEMSFDPDPELSIASIVEAGRAHPDADVVLAPGMPGRILDLLPAAEAELGRPIVSYFAIWRNCLRHLGRRPDRPAGRLLDSLG